jgi:aryl-alcohol dehydrogenase-like predicted oxidoreductase
MISRKTGSIVFVTSEGGRFPTPGLPDNCTPANIRLHTENSLKRLGVEMIDLYMLHRPDYLGDPHEIAGAFLVGLRPPDIDPQSSLSWLYVGYVQRD